MNKLLKLLFRRLNTINIIFQANNCTIKYLQRMPQTVRKINHFGDNKKNKQKEIQKEKLLLPRNSFWGSLLNLQLLLKKSYV